jgi:hypothetical protein
MSWTNLFTRLFRRTPAPDPYEGGAFGGAGTTETWRPDSVPVDSKLPLGLRHNNPLNVRPLANHQTWRGQVGVTGSNFCIFATADEGIRAGALNLRNYQRFHGIDNLVKIVRRYAPAEDQNDEVAYVKSLENQTGWNAFQRLDLQDRHTLANLVRAMIRHEQGVQPFPPEVIQAAVDNALLAP